MHVLENYWLKPISVALLSGITRTFYSVEDSIDFLENEWPTCFGLHHRRAHDLCRAAQKKLTSLEVAREAFIGACLEAAMPLVLSLPVQNSAAPHLAPAE